MSTLSESRLGIRAFDFLDHKFDQATNLIVIGCVGVFLNAEKPNRKLLGHVDVHTDELAVLILEVPWRIGRAGSNDDLAAIQHFLEQAIVDAVGGSGTWLVNPTPAAPVNAAPVLIRPRRLNPAMRSSCMSHLCCMCRPANHSLARFPERPDCARAIPGPGVRWTQRGASAVGHSIPPGP